MIFFEETSLQWRLSRNFHLNNFYEVNFFEWTLMREIPFKEFCSQMMFIKEISLKWRVSQQILLPNDVSEEFFFLKWAYFSQMTFVGGISLKWRLSRTFISSDAGERNLCQMRFIKEISIQWLWRLLNDVCDFFLQNFKKTSLARLLI